MDFDNVAVHIDANEFIMGGNHLVFAGHPKAIRELSKTHGLILGDEVVNVGSGTLISSLIMVAMVVTSALGIMPLLQCAFIAAGAMFFPIMYHAAEQLGYEPYPFLIALMISVSSSFVTPIGSPTHMLVYGPGGYRFSDFIRIGLPMNFIILAANILIVNLIYPLTPLQ